METLRDDNSSDESVLTKIERLYELRRHYCKLSDWARTEMSFVYKLDCCHSEAAVLMKGLKDAGAEIDESQCEWHRQYARKCEARYQALAKAHDLYQRKIVEIRQEIDLLESDDN